MAWRSPGGLSYHLEFLLGYRHSGLCLTSGCRGRRAVSWSRAGAECLMQTQCLNCFEDFKAPSHLLRMPLSFFPLGVCSVKVQKTPAASLTSVGEKAVEPANSGATLKTSHDEAK